MSMLAPFSFPTVTYGIVIFFLVRGSLLLAAFYLRQKPSAALGFIDPNFDQARGSNVTMLVTHVVRLAQTRGQRFVVLGQLSDHVLWIDIVCVVIEHALKTGDVTDRLDRQSANLSNSFRDRVGHGEKLVAVFVKKQVIIAEVWTAHVPVEILGLQIEREHVRQNCVHGAANIFGGRTCEIGRCCQWSVASLPKLCGSC